MKPLLNKTIIARFHQLGSQEEVNDPIVIAKLFNPLGSQRWYLTEYDPDTNIAFGYVTGMAFDEWGYVSMDEMEAIRLPFGLSIERDLYFSEVPISTIISRRKP